MPTQAQAPEAAFAAVQNRVYAPVLFTKIARDYGIKPANETEAQQMLTMAAQLRTAHDAREKQAGTGSMLNAASQHLQNTLGLATSAEDDLVKTAAAETALDPELAHAVLSLQLAAAQAA